MSLSTDFNFNTDRRPHSLPAAGERLDTCPWCDQSIPPEKLAEISGRMAARENDLMIEATGRLKDQFAHEQAQAEARAQSDLDQVRREAALEAERTRQAVLAGVQTRLAEADTAQRLAEQEVLALKNAHEGEMLRRVQEARAAFEQERSAAVLAEQTKTFEERQKLQGKVQDLQRQLENKTAQELGEGAGINLYDVLRATFPDDRILRRVKTSAYGADIVHEVVHNGKPCGRIVYDSKNRGFWQREYVLKLMEDQIAERADHAILSSNKFPAGFRQLHVQDGVVMACPARVLALAGLFRAHIVQLHESRMSNEARAEKTAALYTFVTSERCGQLLDMIETLSKKVLDLDLDERKAHMSMWEKRSRFLNSVLKAQGDLCFEIDRIIGTGVTTP